MVLSETEVRVFLKLAAVKSDITQTPDGALLVTPKPQVKRNSWRLVMLVGLLDPLDGIFDMWESVIRIPRQNLPEGFVLNAPPDEKVALAHVEVKAQENAESVAVEITEKDVHIQKLRENFKLRMTS